MSLHVTFCRASSLHYIQLLNRPLSLSLYYPSLSWKFKSRYPENSNASLLRIFLRLPFSLTLSTSFPCISLFSLSLFVLSFCLNYFKMLMSLAPLFNQFPPSFALIPDFFLIIYVVHLESSLKILYRNPFQISSVP